MDSPSLALLRPSSPSVLTAALPTNPLPPLNASQIDAYREQDRFLPIANVSRLMKKPLSSGSKVSKDAKELLQESVSEFISFLTSEANDKCLNEKRKTINGEDIIWSLRALGFEKYHQCLTVYLAKYRTYQLVARAEKEEEREAETSHTGGGAKRRVKRKREEEEDEDEDDE